MAIQNRPTENPGFVQFARYWNPSGSSTRLWVQEMEPDPYRPGDFRAKRILRLLRWGNALYVPLEEGMHIGIGLYNGAHTWRAFPTYIEAANLWVGGPEQPNDCSPDHMWELRPNDRFVMDKLVNPDSQRGRPLTIVRSGSGFAIGEATFGTDEFRGQIRVYERTQLFTRRQGYRRENEGYTTRGGPVRTRGDIGTLGGSRGGGGVFESMEPPLSYGMPKGLNVDPGATRGGGFEESLRGDTMGIFPPSEGRAAIGAGEEVYQNHVDTGVQYNRDAQPVAALRIEFRTDLVQMLNEALGRGRWNWDFEVPTHDFWWDLAEPAPVAPHLPVAPRPHRPRGY